MLNHDNQYISSERVPHRDRELLAGVAHDFGSTLTRSWGNLQYAILQSTPELREQQPQPASVPPSPEVAMHAAGISPAEESVMEQRAYEPAHQVAATETQDTFQDIVDANFTPADQLTMEQQALQDVYRVHDEMRQSDV